MEWYCWILLILGIAFAIFLTGCKKKEEEEENGEEENGEEEEEEVPDPHPWKWKLVDDTTQRWADYCEYMQRITSDTLVALEMRFYKWVSDWDLWNKLDHWARPDVVWVNKKDDCDGLARLTCDMLGRFVMKVLKSITEVHWLEYYGFYRKYIYNPDTGEYSYKIVAGGHAITVYKKDGKLLAFSNTSWWNKLNFQDYIEIGEQTFPEGLYFVICRHWETGKAQWILDAEEGEILQGTNVFHRELKLIRNLKPLKKGERKKIINQFKKKEVSKE